jgi:cardiolipin synthase
MSELLNSQIKVFNLAEETWQKMLDDINAANKSIVFEQFIFLSFSEGQIGLEFVKAFIAAAEKGVDVALNLDAVGSISLLKNKGLKKRLRNSGVELNFYQTIPLRNATTPIRFFVRNHRKVLLIDQQISWIGGTVMKEEFRDWQDYNWRIDSNQFGEELHSELIKQHERLVTGKRSIAPFSKLSPEIRLVGNSPGIGNRHVYEQISEHILVAKNKVCLVTPYFTPPLRLYRVLKEKLKDGLEIKLLTPKQTDHGLADWARWWYLKQLQPLGLKIYFTDHMNHAKIVTADNWASFGSTNLDYLSLVFNHELNIDFEEGSKVELINSQVNRWLGGDYYYVDEEMLQDVRPSWWQRFLGRILVFIT